MISSGKLLYRYIMAEHVQDSVPLCYAAFVDLPVSGMLLRPFVTCLTKHRDDFVYECSNPRNFWIEISILGL